MFRFPVRIIAEASNAEEFDLLRRAYKAIKIVIAKAPRRVHYLPDSVW